MFTSRGRNVWRDKGLELWLEFQATAHQVSTGATMNPIGVFNRRFQMNPILILYPVFAQIALTFALLFMTGRSRVKAVTSGEVKVNDIALGQSAWPPHVTQFSRSYQNQFELPVLFYVLAGLLLITHHVDYLMLAVAWLFVALRYAHAFIHTTSNTLRTRFNLFTAGLVVLAAMWVIFAARIAMA